MARHRDHSDRLVSVDIRRPFLTSPNLFVLFAIIPVLVAYLLSSISLVQCYGVMSVDLGSEWMKVGLVAPSVQMDLVLNAQSQRKTPMAIAS